MRKLFVPLAFLLTIYFGYAQVGINTTTPAAQLEIKSTNQATPANNDGILIPKIDAFPVTNPTAAQNSMMVYLTTTSAGKQPGFYYWDNATTSWKGFGNGSGWNLTGNSGTTPGTNFVGTTDDKPLIFKTNNIQSGYLGGSDNYAVFFGHRAGEINTGFWNVGIGSYALNLNTWGSSNVAIGQLALNKNTTGYSNFALGTVAMNDNTIGNNNVAIGEHTLDKNVTGSYAVAIGSYAMQYSNDTTTAFDNKNVAIGYQSLMGSTTPANNTGNNNTALGYQSLTVNTSGSNNLAFGTEALSQNTTGSSNIAIGNSTLSGNTSGSNNIVIGNNANVNTVNGSNQLSINNVIYGTGMNSTITSKIGINASAPSAKLQINPSNASTPAVDDGIIIPRVNTFPILNPNAAQNGMMIFLATVNPGYPIGFYYWDNPSTSWKGVGANTANAWGLNGNAGTDSTINFIGTTDLASLRFKVQNLPAGILDNSQRLTTYFGIMAGASDTGFDNVGIGFGALKLNVIGNGNTALGSEALSKNLSDWNTAVGYKAMEDNTIGVSNVALGSGSLRYNKAGSNAVAIGNDAMRYANDKTTAFDNKNVAVGYQSLMGSTTPANNTGNNNTAVGYQTLVNNLTGGNNVAIGVFSMSSNQTGVGNTAVGSFSLTDNTTGFHNTGIGDYALQNNTTGDNSVSIGTYSLMNNDIGSSNIAIGLNAMYENRAGSKAIAIGEDAMRFANNRTTAYDNGNVAVGYHSLMGSLISANNTGNSNTAIGYRSLEYNSSGSNNIAFGVRTLISNSSGSNNIAIGSPSLFENVTGSNNISIGNTTLSGNIAGSNNIAIGNNANVNTVNGSNQLSISNVIYGMNMNDLATAPANISIGDTPSTNNRLYVFMNQLTANGDGQNAIYGYRTRDSRNDGTGYGIDDSNGATSGYNVWGDSYTFGTTGFCFNDFTRTGGVLGASVGGTYWSSLGYKSSASVTYGIYSSAAGYGSGTGRMAQTTTEFSIGGGFYGGLIGSWSRGNLIGAINSGNLFASYNNGDEYTSGKQIELVVTGASRTAAYAVTSTESVIYKKGKINLNNGVARVEFDEKYKKLLGDIPVVTTTPMGQCNGIYIESVDKNGFTIKELSNGTSNVTISWIAVGDRIDANRTSIPDSILSKDFDSNLNEVMFNENNLNNSGKAMWSDGNKINFGQLPPNLIDKPVKDKK
ncbi:beta strand repeat-containing protein [Flavobacterium capsici]|uniref:Peptidase S74 domain-containing protein n=1 Tax=Flavobacterium capsici TaxID=3075618 RepID=A0AA96F2D9_9FLAO|nr:MULTISPECIES: hypothetical protein [unclassified Flavobacterium]WNM19921.1 hypothetical protein RN608_04375 [Flavobacterium sp. PMR2A8]WNM21310.1 hypothetical protein RN605_11545 [Flavobacterium sp. PMTSA4]